MTIFLGVDIGSTRTKVGAYDTEEQRLVGVEAVTTETRHDGVGEVRDLTSMLATVSDLLDCVLGAPEAVRRSVSGIAVGSVGEEVVPLDAERRAVGPALTWYGGHGPAARKEMVASDPRGPWRGLDASFSVFKLAWLSRHRPDQLAAAASFTDLADFVALSLTGESTASVAMNLSHASRTGLVDVRARTWDDEVVGALGVDLALPALVSSGTLLGHTRGTGLLPAGVPVIAAGHDHFCGAFGSGVRSSGSAYVSAGTSEAQLVLTEAIPRDVSDSIDIGFFVSAGLTYLHRATPAGRYFQDWHGLLFGGVTDERMWEEVARAQDVDPARIDVERRTVGFPPFALGVDRGVIMASLQRGLAHHAESTTDRLARDAGVAITNVAVAGVPATSTVWRQIRQSASVRQLRFIVEPEATLLGVCLLAQQAVTGTADDPASYLQEQKGFLL
jgi:xylulokinase